MTTEPVRRQLYVAHFVPNGQFSTQTIVESPIETPDPRLLPELPDDVFAVQFFERVETVVTLDDGSTHKLQGPQFNPSQRFFMRGKLYRIEEIEELFPSAVHAINNLKKFEINKAVKFNGYWFPYVHGEDLHIPKYGTLLDTPNE